MILKLYVYVYLLNEIMEVNNSVWFIQFLHIFLSFKSFVFVKKKYFFLDFYDIHFGEDRWKGSNFTAIWIVNKIRNMENFAKLFCTVIQYPKHCRIGKDKKNRKLDISFLNGMPQILKIIRKWFERLIWNLLY